MDFELYQSYDLLQGKEQVCWECQQKFISHRPYNERQYCEKCFEEKIKKHEEIVSQYANLKVQIMHEKALRTLEKNYHIVMEELKEANDAIIEMEKMKSDAFLSSQEIVTAILLYDAGVFFKVNHKILNYKIDFFLPDDKICLEIDGGFHDMPYVRKRDGKRDIEIRHELGAEWETVRIPTNYVEKHPGKLVDAIFEIADKQRKLRKEHNGMLPENYSKSTKAYYGSLSSYEVKKVKKI